jgi:hypothetical protein
MIEFKPGSMLSNLGKLQTVAESIFVYGDKKTCSFYLKKNVNKNVLQ